MKVSGFWMRHVALGLLCLLLLSAVQTASALPGKGRGVGSHRSGSGKGGHAIGGLLSGHDGKKKNDKSDDKKHGIGGLLGHDDKKKNDKSDGKKHGLGGLLGHDDKKKNDKSDDKKHGIGGLLGHGDKKKHDKTNQQKPGQSKPGNNKPSKGSKHGKDKCKASKSGSSRSRKPTRRDIIARDLALRDDPPIPQDGIGNAPAGGNTLHTINLKTCIGIAITGDGGIFGHWLLHSSATKFAAADIISKLKRQWDLMGPKNNVKIYFSSPDPDPCKSDPGARDLIDQSQDIAKILAAELKSLTGSSPHVIHRPARDSPTGHEGTMELHGNGDVFVEGRRVN